MALNGWKEIATFLGMSVDYAKKLPHKHKDFPISKEGRRVFTTREALIRWVRLKAPREASHGLID